MRITATQLRKDLFQTMDRVASGERVEVLHKGQPISLTADRPSRMSRLIRRDTIVGSPDDLEDAQAELSRQIADTFEKKWAQAE